MTKAAVACLCLYEVGAITTGRVPTITAVCRRWPVLKVVLLGSLAVHLYRRLP
jgi:hypothetical protein